MSLSGDHYHQTEEKEYDITEKQIMMNLTRYLTEEKLITPDEKVKLLDFISGDRIE